MSEKIEPALSAEAWHFSSAAVRPAFAVAELRGLYDSNGDAQPLDLADMPKVIALANAALPNSDRRKITRGMVSWLREEADVLQRNGAGAGALIAAEIAAALESYLPPE